MPALSPSRVKRNIKSFTTSTDVLYALFILVFVNIGYYIIYENHESLFLFIIMSFVIYTLNKNMIFVLGIPLIMVNFLSLMKSQINIEYYNIEGFDVMKDDFIKKEDKIAIYYWIKDNMETEENIEYMNFDLTLDEEEDISPLKNIIETITTTPYDKENETPVIDAINDFIKYLKYISTMDSITRDENKEEVDYVNQLTDQITKHMMELRDEPVIENPKIDTIKKEDYETNINTSTEDKKETGMNCDCKYKEIALKLMK